jgi:O-antigen ligase
MLRALLGTETRGAIAAAVAGLFVVVFLTVPRRERLPLGIVAGLGGGLGIGLFLQPILTYLARGESAENLATVSNRTELWGIAFDLVREHPVTGWGLATSRGIFFDKVGLGGAHNAFVNVLVDGGLIGVTLWISFVIAIGVGIRRLYRAGHRDAPLLAGLLTALMVNGLTVEGVGSGIGMSALWLLMTGAWVGVLQREIGALRERTSSGVELDLTHRPSASRELVSSGERLA